MFNAYHDFIILFTSEDVGGYFNEDVGPNLWILVGKCFKFRYYGFQNAFSSNLDRYSWEMLDHFKQNVLYLAGEILFQFQVQAMVFCSRLELISHGLFIVLNDELISPINHEDCLEKGVGSLGNSRRIGSHAGVSAKLKHAGQLSTL